MTDGHPFDSIEQPLFGIKDHIHEWLLFVLWCGNKNALVMGVSQLDGIDGNRIDFLENTIIMMSNNSAGRNE